MAFAETTQRFKVFLFLLAISLLALASYVANDRYPAPLLSPACGIGCQGRKEKIHNDGYNETKKEQEQQRETNTYDNWSTAWNSTEYVIHTPGCIIPDFDPLHPSIVKYRQKSAKPSKLVCSTKLPLTDKEDLTLLLHYDRLGSYGSSRDTVNCYYQGIHRIEQDPKKYDKDCDRKYKLKSKMHINTTRTLVNEDAIVVTCEDTKKKKRIYRDAFYFLQPRKIQEKIKKFKETDQQGVKQKQLSVIIMGTDSVSRGNLRRHMPKTFDYLKNELHAIDLQGFNKIGENTNPNLFAMLTGLSYEDLKPYFHPNTLKTSKFDDCPFIWKNFSDKGYATIYTEDAPSLGIFHFKRFGFVREPTDYYTRAYFLASEKLIGAKGKLIDTSSQPCQGPRLSSKLIHQLSLDMAKSMGDVPHFGLYWTTSLSHGSLELPLLIDEPSVSYLKKLHKGNYLQNTILFFLSDHGIRYGKFRQTYPGLVEENMPYVMMKFPDWFMTQYPEAIKNVLTNTRRLTSTYDLHATLQDILNQGYANLNDERGPPLKHGQSLFRKVPLNRTCSQAGIPTHYCACQTTKAADPKDPRLLSAAKVVVKELNYGLQNFPNCSTLDIDQVVSGRIGLPSSGSMPKKSDMITVTNMVTFTVKPGGGMMQATVKEHMGEFTLASDVSRINIYGNQSHCIEDFVYKKYCFCKDLL